MMYKLVRVLSEGLVGLSSEYGWQLWVICKVRKQHECVGCRKSFSAGSKMYRPLTNLSNRMRRLCGFCIRNLPVVPTSPPGGGEAEEKSQRAAAAQSFTREGKEVCRMGHERLVEKAKKAISKVFYDTSVSQETTRESLEALVEEIMLLLETLD